jgi:hemolysin D
MQLGSLKIIPFPKAAARRTVHEIAFLPAALEITESPPSPIGRAIGVTIVGAFCFAVAWASFGKVDIVVTSSGRIVPSGGAKVIQPFETGVVSAIHVRDGQKVKTGDVLIELDPTMNAAEHDRLNDDLVAAKLTVARLRAALAWQPSSGADPLNAFEPPEGASSAQIETERQYLASQIAEQNSKIAEIDRQTAQKEAERATVTAQTAKLEATIPLLQQRVDVRKTLYDKALGSKLVYLQDKQDLVGMEQDVAVEQSRAHEADAAIASLRESRNEAEADFRRTIFGELTKAQAQAAGLAQDTMKAARRTALQILTAPVDGVVQQLAVHTIGGVVTPAQALAVVVPVASPIEIEAILANRDIGFVHAGQEVAIKVETFSFTRYGLIHGSVMSVSRDAVTTASPPDHGNGGGGSAGAEQPRQESNYIARVALDQTRMKIDGHEEQLTPGMAVAIEIKTGSRRIISYLLSPLEKNFKESMQER